MPSSLLPFPHAGLVLAPSADFVLGAPASCQRLDEGLLMSDFPGLLSADSSTPHSPDRSPFPKCHQRHLLLIRTLVLYYLVNDICLCFILQGEDKGLESNPRRATGGKSPSYAWSNALDRSTIPAP